MNEHPMTHRESLELISSMIAETRRRYRIDDGRPHLFWGYLDIVVALVVWITHTLTGSELSHFLWFLIPVVGIPASRMLFPPTPAEGYALSYTDRLLSSMWRFIGLLSFGLALICLFFSLGGHAVVWSLMFVYGLVVVGMGAVISGLLLELRSLVIGGTIAILSGAAVAAATLAEVPLRTAWLIPLFIACQVAMFVIPGHLMRAHARRAVRQQNTADA